MIEFLFELVGEFLLQVFGELLVELGLRALVEPFQARPNAWFAAPAYLVFGAACGALSVWLVPYHLTPPVWRLPNLVLTPVAVGGVMAALGHWRARRGQAAPLIDRFAYGYLFALALAVVRYFFAD